MSKTKRVVATNLLGRQAQVDTKVNWGMPADSPLGRNVARGTGEIVTVDRDNDGVLVIGVLFSDGTITEYTSDWWEILPREPAGALKGGGTITGLE